MTMNTIPISEQSTPNESNIEQLLEEIENSKNTYEYEICEKFMKLEKLGCSKLNLPAEVIAFGFRENDNSADDLSSNYFFPMMEFQNSVFPSPEQVTVEFVNYWNERLGQTSNSILKARYSALIWDFSKKLGLPVGSKMALTSIDNIISIVENKLLEFETHYFAKLNRALQLAINIKNEEYIGKVKASLIILEFGQENVEKRGLWGHCFDWLVTNKKVHLSNEEEQRIILDLEKKMATASSDSSLSYFIVESAALRLLSYYNEKRDTTKVFSILDSLKSSYDAQAPNNDGISNHNFLTKLHNLFISYGYRDKINQILVEIQKNGLEISKGLEEHSFEVQIKKEDIENFLHALMEGSFDEVISRFIIYFIPSKEKTEELVLKLSQKHPLSYLVTQYQLDNKGRVVSTINPIYEGINAHIVKQMSQDIQVTGQLVAMSINAMEKQINFNAETIVALLSLSPIFEQYDLNIIKKGLDSYFQKDYVSAVHLLVPRIESIIRTLIEMMNLSILKTTPSRSEGYMYKTLDELLRMPEFSKVFGSNDIAYYFQVLLTNPLGINVRNIICHGISEDFVFARTIVDRLIHCLLILGQVRVN